jgi:ComF family protein
LKYSGKTTGLDSLKWISKQSAVLNDLVTPDIIIPVPLHKNRLRKRGFNQAVVLAELLFKEEKRKIRYSVLVRKVDTPAQAGLSGQARRKNLKNVFVVEKSAEVAEKTALILDDVYTTGTTTQECAKVLKAAGCRRVEVLTICRAHKKVL